MAILDNFSNILILKTANLENMGVEREVALGKCEILYFDFSQLP